MTLDLLMIGEAAPAPAGGGLLSFLPMVLIFGFMLFWLFRTQKKEARKRQDMIDSTKVGDKIITAGGIHGTIAAVKEKTFLVKIAENIKVEVSKTGISAVLDASSENSDTAEKK